MHCSTAKVGKYSLCPPHTMQALSVRPVASLDRTRQQSFWIRTLTLVSSDIFYFIFITYLWCKFCVLLGRQGINQSKSVSKTCEEGENLRPRPCTKKPLLLCLVFRAPPDLTPLVLLASSPNINTCSGALCLFAHSFRHSSNKHLLSTSCVPGTVPG